MLTISCKVGIYNEGVMKLGNSVLLVFVLEMTALTALAQPADDELSVPMETMPGFGILHWTITPGMGVRLLDINVTSKQTGAAGRITNDGSFSNPIYWSLDIESPTLTLGN